MLKVDLPYEDSFRSCFKAEESNFTVAWALFKTKDCKAFSLVFVSAMLVVSTKTLFSRLTTTESESAV